MNAKTMQALCAALLVFAFGAGALAQDVDNGEVVANGVEGPTSLASNVEREDDARWAPLQDLRLEHHAHRRMDGWLLTGWGVVSAVGGLVMSIAGRDDAFWLSQGLTTLSFAAFNIPLGIGLLDVSGSRLRDIQNNRHGDLLAYDEVLEAAISAQRSKRTSLAVNGALDVLYMVGGALLVALATRTSSRNTAAGAGWAMIAQGAVLLAFDIYGVVVSSRNMADLRQLRN